MIFIVSLILTFSFALSAVFIGFGPNVYRLSNKGFKSRVIQNAELEAMQYGNLYLRSGALDTDSGTANIPNSIDEIKNLFIYNIIGLGADQKMVSTINITSSITANKDPSGVVKITVSAR